MYFILHILLKLINVHLYECAELVNTSWSIDLVENRKQNM